MADNKNKILDYKIKISRRAKRMRIAVYADSSVVLTLPFGLRQFNADKFILQKQGWILKSLDYFSARGGSVFGGKNREIVKSGKREYAKYRTQALTLAKDKVKQWNNFYNFSFRKINIKNQKTRWGSCSKKGNLNFNYKIVHLPEKLVNYLVVHELCHLKEFNHSKSFWGLVAQTVPDYKALRQELKNFGMH